MRSFRFACPIVMLFLSGCASIDYDRGPAADWPALEIRIIKQDFKQVQRTCRNDFWPAQQVNGCAIFEFAALICHIYTWTDDRRVIEHERAHCAGYDHPGSSAMRDAWARFKSEAKRGNLSRAR